ncbi:MAG: DNA alkylation repair protein [Muribaculaceae bacterium]|nr:DNA alkylation repair protein [Muribaculaceae bacterium]
MMQKIKKEFFAYRNGMLADTLRNHGDPHKVIFGLNVPQIASIARNIIAELEDSPEQNSTVNRESIARSLWTDREVRESRLLATYLFDPANTTIEQAVALAKDVRTTEEADMLAFRLFKRMKDADKLLSALLADPDTARAANSLLPHLD